MEETKATKITDSFVCFSDKTCWPNPNSESEWKLRHTKEPMKRGVLAAYLGAYRSLIWMTAKEREQAIRKIRKALKEP